MRNGERDQAALGAVDQPLLDQRRPGPVTGWTACGPSSSATTDVGTGSSPSRGHRPHVLALGRGGPLVPAAEEADGQLALGLGGGHLDVVGGDRARRGARPRSPCRTPGRSRGSRRPPRRARRAPPAVNSRPPAAAGAISARSAASRSSRSMRWRTGTAARSSSCCADSTAGRCGRPAPTTISGAAGLGQLVAGGAERGHVGRPGCPASRRRTGRCPTPRSAATDAASANSSVRSISRSPESARPRAAGTSMPSCRR